MLRRLSVLLSSFALVLASCGDDDDGDTGATTVSADSSGDGMMVPEGMCRTHGDCPSGEFCRGTDGSACVIVAGGSAQGTCEALPALCAGIRDCGCLTSTLMCGDMGMSCTADSNCIRCS